jgi:hypothetical protein
MAFNNHSGDSLIDKIAVSTCRRLDGLSPPPLTIMKAIYTDKEKAQIRAIIQEVKGVHSSAFGGWDEEIKFLLKMVKKAMK